MIFSYREKNRVDILTAFFVSLQPDDSHVYFEFLCNLTHAGINTLRQFYYKINLLIYIIKISSYFFSSFYVFVHSNKKLLNSIPEGVEQLKMLVTSCQLATILVCVVAATAWAESPGAGREKRSEVSEGLLATLTGQATFIDRILCMFP